MLSMDERDVCILSYAMYKSFGDIEDPYLPKTYQTMPVFKIFFLISIILS